MPDPLSRIPTPDLAAVYFAAQCLWMGDDSAAQSAFYAALADELRRRLQGMMGEWLEWRRGLARAAGPQIPPPPPPGERPNEEIQKPRKGQANGRAKS